MTRAMFASWIVLCGWWASPLRTLAQTTPSELAPNAAPPVPGVRYALRDPSRDDARLHAVDRRLAELELALAGYPYTGPTIMIGVGGGIAVVSLLVDMSLVIRELVGMHDEDSHAPESFERTVQAMGIVAAGGAAVALCGLGWLVKRKRDRRPYARERKDLRRERGDLLAIAPRRFGAGAGIVVRAPF